MPADNSHLIVAAARRRATATRRRAGAALRRMGATGAAITFETAAREAGVPVPPARVEALRLSLTPKTRRTVGTELRERY